MPQIPPTPSISGNTISGSQQSALGFKPGGVAAVQARPAVETVVRAVETPQLFSRLMGLQQAVGTTQQLSGLIRMAQSQSEDVETALLHIRALIPKMQKETEGSPSRIRTEQQAAGILGKLAAEFGISDGRLNKAAAMPQRLTAASQFGGNVQGASQQQLEDLEVQLLQTRALVSRLEQETGGSPARSRLEQQIAGHIARIAASFGPDRGRGVSLGGMASMEELESELASMRVAMLHPVGSASLTDARIKDIGPAIALIRSLIPRILAEEDGTPTRSRLEQQLIGLIADFVAKFGQEAGSRTKLTQDGMQDQIARLIALISDFADKHAAFPAHAERKAGAIVSGLGVDARHIDDLSTRLRATIEQLVRSMPANGQMRGAQLAQMTALIDRALQQQTALLAQLPVLNARLGGLLSELTSLVPPAGPSAGQPVELLSLAQMRSLGQELSLSRLAAAHAATSQYFDLMRMKKAIRRDKKGQAHREKSSINGKNNLFDNFLHFFGGAG